MEELAGQLQQYQENLSFSFLSPAVKLLVMIAKKLSR